MNEQASGCETSYASGHDFGLVDIDTMSTQFTWVVTNSTEVASGALELTNTNLDEFITQSDCAELPPYGSCSIFVRFQPTGFGVRSGKLMLVSPLSPTAQVWLSVMGRGR